MTWLKGDVLAYRMKDIDSLDSQSLLYLSDDMFDLMDSNTQDWLVSVALDNTNVVHPALTKCFARRNW